MSPVVAETIVVILLALCGGMAVGFYLRRRADSAKKAKHPPTEAPNATPVAPGQSTKAPEPPAPAKGGSGRRR